MKKEYRSIGSPGAPEPGCGVDYAMLEQEKIEAKWNADALEFYKRPYDKLSKKEKMYIRRGVKYPIYRGRLS